MKCLLALAGCCVIAVTALADAADSAQAWVAWQELPPLPDAHGFAGMYAGTSNGALIVAGGANFPEKPSWEGGQKVWHDTIWVLEKPGGAWKRAEQTLPRPMGYGVSVTHGETVICIGGNNLNGHYADVFALKWEGGRVQMTPLPPLPDPSAYMCGVVIGSTVYVAGGLEQPEAQASLHRFRSMDLSKPVGQMKWEVLEPWPGPARHLAIAAAQDGAFYLISGMRLTVGDDGRVGLEAPYLSDAYRYTPGAAGAGRWERIADLPRPVAAAPSPGLALGRSHVLVFGGLDGANLHADPRQFPPFPRQILAYQAATDTWVPRGEMPEGASRVTAPTTLWHGKMVIPSGEVGPGRRSPKVYEVTPRQAEASAGLGKPEKQIWLAPRVEAMPAGLPAGPFVMLGKDRILAIDKTEAMISRDEGQTWQRYPIFADPDAFEIRREHALLRTREGTIVLAWLNDKERRWTWNDDLKDAPGAKLPTYTVRSLDGGRTWEPPQKLHGIWTGAVRDIIQTRDGQIVFTSMMMLHDPGRHAAVTYVSENDGATWTRSNLIDLGGRGHHDGALEPTLTQLHDGRLWMLIRTNWGVFWEAFSSDDGRSWRALRPTGIDASSAPGIAKRLASGRLALVWNRLYPEGKTDYPRVGGDGIWSAEPAVNHRDELAIAFSEDDGKTWSRPIVIARAPGKRLSYPHLFERRAGELWITTMQGGLRVKLRELDLLAEEQAEFHTDERAHAGERPIRVACVGDSITYGAGIRGRERNSYPAELGRLLGNGYEVRNFGHNGTTAIRATLRPYLTQPEFAWATAFEPDVVVLMLGTNDAGPSTWARQKLAFAKDYAALIEHFQSLPSRPRVWVCTPVPLMPGRDEVRMNNLAQEIVPLIREAAQATGASLIELHGPTFTSMTWSTPTPRARP